MWECTQCAESHEDQFATCWKCGTNRSGGCDPDFRVSEPVTEQDQAPVSQADETQFPVLQLPTITYFSLPPYLWTSLVMLVADYQAEFLHQPPEFAVSPTKIVLWGIGIVLVGIPIFLTMARAFFWCIIRRKMGSNRLSEWLWPLSMFLLPESFRRLYRWFVPVYYFSIGAYLVGPIAVIVWHVVRMS